MLERIKRLRQERKQILNDMQLLKSTFNSEEDQREQQGQGWFIIEDAKLFLDFPRSQYLHSVSFGFKFQQNWIHMWNVDYWVFKF